MSDAVKAVICGTQKSFRKTQFCIPLTTQIVNDAGDIASIIDEDSTLVRFIILFLDLLHQNVDSILTELSSRNNVIVTLILDNPINDLTINQRNVLRISKHLITYSTTSYAIRAYESRAKELSKGQEGLATVLEGEADRLRQWLIKYNKVMACHILIIPLNTTYRSLISFQLDLIELCKSLGINKEIIVCTIYDYIGLEESNPDELQDSSFLFQREHRRAVCQLMQELAPIRIYLVGNEARITNYWSRLLIPKELDNGRENVFKYTGACTFPDHSKTE